MTEHVEHFSRVCAGCRGCFQIKVTVQIPDAGLLASTVKSVRAVPPDPFLCWKCEAAQRPIPELDDDEYALRNMVG